MSVLTPDQVHQTMQADPGQIMLLDVRSKYEFASSYIPGSENLPLDQLEAEFSSLPQDKLIVLSCLSGQRSKVARDFLAAQGFQQLGELQGGLVAWSQHGLPVVAQPSFFGTPQRAIFR